MKSKLHRTMGTHGKAHHMAVLGAGQCVVLLLHHRQEVAHYPVPVHAAAVIPVLPEPVLAIRVDDHSPRHPPGADFGIQVSIHAVLTERFMVVTPAVQ